jgi:hypothetical protein
MFTTGNCEHAPLRGISCLLVAQASGLGLRPSARSPARDAG